jgi:hypothetical protein
LDLAKVVVEAKAKALKMQVQHLGVIGYYAMVEL